MLLFPPSCCARRARTAPTSILQFCLGTPPSHRHHPRQRRPQHYNYCRCRQRHRATCSRTALLWSSVLRAENVGRQTPVELTPWRLGRRDQMVERGFGPSMEGLVGRSAAVSSDGGGRPPVDGRKLRGRGGTVSIAEQKRAYGTSEGASVAHVWTRQVGINYRSNYQISQVIDHLRDCTKGYLRPTQLQPLLERAHGLKRTKQWMLGMAAFSPELSTYRKQSFVHLA